jgi:hypothetical protein
MDDLFKPVTIVKPRPRDRSSTDMLYVRSFLVLRTFIGALGVLLPVLVVFLDQLLFDGVPYGTAWPRGSVSVYYYSGMREVFVGTLSATGAFFVAYKVWERNLENLLSWAAGLSACLIALFPTWPPSTHVPATPLQKLLEVSFVSQVHYVASAAFLVSLMLISFFFGLREGKRASRVGMKRSPRFWRWFHWVCAGLMAAALLWIIAANLTHVWSRSTLVGEWICAWAFGASWFWKGLELDTIRGRPAKEVAPGPTL